MNEQQSRAPNISRREFLRGGAALGITGGGLGTILTACGVGSGGTSNRSSAARLSGSTTLTYWNWFSGAGGPYMTKMVDAFNKSQKHVTVNATVYTLPQYWTKLASAISVNKGPDVAALKVSELQEFVSHGLLTPIDPNQLARYGISAKDFPATSWKACHANGALYGLPIDTEGSVFYYNTKLFGDANLLQSNHQLKPVVGDQAFLSALKASQAAGAQYGLSVGFSDAWTLWYMFYSQLNGKVVSSDGKRVMLDDKKGATAAELLQEIGAGQKLAPLTATGNDVGTLFAGQKAASLIASAASFVDFVKTRQTPFDVTYIPKIFDKQVTVGDTSALVIPRHRNQPQDHVDAVLTFMAGALQRSIYWAEGAHIPDYLPVRQTKEFKALIPQAHIVNQANYIVYLPSVSYLTELNTDATATWEAVFQGHATPQAGYRQFRSQLEQLAKKA